MDIYLLDNYATQATGNTSTTVYSDSDLNNSPISFHFPVNPFKSISTPTERRFKTSDIIGYGQIDIQKSGSNIEEISFETLFPKEFDEAYCRCAITDTPLNIVNRFKNWQNQDKPLRLIITDLNINMFVTISKFTPTYYAGEEGDAYISITFRQHREYKIETLQSASSGQQLNSRSGGSSSYKKGDKVKTRADTCVYASNSMTSKYLGKIKANTEVTVYAVYGNWISIYYGNSGGYIGISMVTK